MKQKLGIFAVLMASASGLAFDIPSATASSLESIFQSGNRAFATGDTQQAIVAYRRLITLGVEDADVYFNLGTAYARLGKYGHAIQFFERAARLRPTDDSIDRSLRLAVLTLTAQHAEKFPSNVAITQPPLKFALLRSVHANTLAFILLFLNLISCGLLVGRTICRPSPRRISLSVASGVAVTMLIVCALLLLAKTGFFIQDRDAVILEDGAQLVEGPSNDSQVRSQALQGERAVVHEQEGKYYRVTFTDGRNGWIHHSHVGKI